MRYKVGKGNEQSGFQAEYCEPAALSLSLSLSLSDNFRHNNAPKLDFDNITSPQALFVAWEKFCRGKRLRTDVLAFERYLEAHVFKLHEQLKNGRYHHSKYQPFTICDPKQRLIHKATVKDRLVHQAIVSAIEPLFERQFIYDSYSCRTGKGTHAAVTRLGIFLGRASKNNTQTVYALKCDVKQFFASVDHDILKDLIRQRVNDERTLAVLDRIIGSLSREPGKGIPLGNLTSQLFANVYLHELDWHIKNKLREKHYIRYCDDFVILSTDRKHLQDLVEPITRLLKDRLALTIHPNKISIRTWHQGIDFLGYVLKPHCKILRHKSKQRALQRVNSNNISSYLGLCSHADAKELGDLLETIAVAGS